MLTVQRTADRLLSLALHNLPPERQSKVRLGEPVELLIGEPLLSALARKNDVSVYLLPCGELIGTCEADLLTAAIIVLGWSADVEEGPNEQH